MSQANDLGQIANQPGAVYRGRANAGFVALATESEGASAPSPAWPHMLWRDAAAGLLYRRNASNSAWEIIENYGASTDPGAGDDAADGYVRGAIWINTLANRLWFCVNPAAGAAVWIQADKPPSSDFGTGDGKITLKAVADAGWILVNDGSIGGPASGATTRANADCQALFMLLWTNISRSWAPLQDNTGATVIAGVSAAADWGASRRLLLPKTLGRALAFAGGGAGLTVRALGQWLGEEAHTQTAAELFPHTHAVNGYQVETANRSLAVIIDDDRAQTLLTSPTGPAGGGQPMNIMQPTVFWNVMIKL